MIVEDLLHLSGPYAMAGELGFIALIPHKLGCLSRVHLAWFTANDNIWRTKIQDAGWQRAGQATG